MFVYTISTLQQMSFKLFQALKTLTEMKRFDVICILCIFTIHTYKFTL